MDIQETKDKFNQVIQKTLPKFYKEVTEHTEFFGNEKYLAIVIAASNYEINKVRGQYIQDVSLMYHMVRNELTIQMFGGNGGNSVYIKPQKNHHLYMERVKIPFRKAKSLESALKTLEKFCINYKQALIENRNILMYQDLINYDDLLS